MIKNLFPPIILRAIYDTFTVKGFIFKSKKIVYLHVNWDLLVSSSACCHPGWKHQHCESVTDRISNQRWSCQRQVRSSMYCYLFVLKKCLPWNNVESIYWNLLQSRGQTPLHNLGQYGKENAAAMFELFRETMPDYPLDIPDSEGNTGKFCHPVCLQNMFKLCQ